MLPVAAPSPDTIGEGLAADRELQNGTARAPAPIKATPGATNHT